MRQDLSHRLPDGPQDLSGSEGPEVARALHPFLVGVFGLVTLLIYGTHLNEGLLADDFLYAHWLDQGFDELLRRLTLASDPRMIRPLPGLGWWVASGTGGVWVQHALSLLLHTLCAFLVARLAERSRTGSGPLAGLLFLTFPLFAEPVIWLSSAFDLWAAFFALAALWVGLRANGQRPAAALLFALSLLSKESTLLLPLLPLCLPAAASLVQRRRLAFDLALVAGTYLLFRLAFFGGPGGYLDDTGQSLAWRLEPLRFLKNALLQVPYRLLVPLKRAGELAPLLSLATATFVGLAVAAVRPWQRPRALLWAPVAFLLALAPTAPVFGIDLDHENSRMLYFPVAMFFVAIVASWRPPGGWARMAILGLAFYWGGASVGNGVSWTEADHEVRSTLAYLAEHQAALPTEATVLVAGHDTWQGAYAWRNALYLAVRRAGLRTDLDWRLGTAALLDDATLPLGRVFEVEVHPKYPPFHVTACQRALRLEPPAPRAVVPLGNLRPLSGALGLGSRLDLPPLDFETPLAAPAVLLTTRQELQRPFSGRLFWHDPQSGGFVDGFSVTEARRFSIARGQRQTIIRLTTPSVPFERLVLRVETDTSDAPAILEELQVLEGSASCRRAPR